MKLKFISWNIWRGQNLDQVIKFLKEQGADVIGLQEVIEPKNEDNQAKFIAESLGYHFIYCKAFTTDRRKPAYGIGNALLSRYPLVSAECLMMSEMEDYQGTSLTEPRVAIKAKISVEGEILNIFCTHLAFNEDHPFSSPAQIKQVEKLISLLSEEKTILLGDFNSQPGSEVVKKISRLLVNTDSNPIKPSWRYVTRQDTFLNLRVDYIFTSTDLDYSGFQILESEASDHKPLSLEVDLGEGAYTKKIKTLKGEEGEQWLTDIPGQIKEIEKKWRITVGSQLSSYINYVASGVDANGNEVVVKIYFPGDPEFAQETEALRIFSSFGVAKLLKVDWNKKIVLLEKVKPGEPVSNLEDDEKATKIIARTMQKLWQPTPKSSVFPTLLDWSKGFKWYFENARAGSPLSRDLVEEAEKIFLDFAKNPHGQYLLHGDLHHGNVLSSGKEGWIAIDPKGVIGEREYEMAAMLRNPYKKLSEMNQDQLKAILNSRLDILAEALGFDRDRMLKWGFAQTILSVIWNMQGDQERWSDWVDIAKVLHELL